MSESKGMEENKSSCALLTCYQSTALSLISPQCHVLYDTQYHVILNNILAKSHWTFGFFWHMRSSGAILREPQPQVNIFDISMREEFLMRVHSVGESFLYRVNVSNVVQSSLFFVPSICWRKIIFFSSAVRFYFRNNFIQCFKMHD